LKDGYESLLVFSLGWLYEDWSWITKIKSNI
jgi:hypothetical protein